MIHLTAEELLYVAERAIGGRIDVRDIGMLEAAAARPRASAFGEDAYPTLQAKAAALVESLARNHALVDGNQRLALAALIAFLGVNGRRLTWSNDEAYQLIVDVATGELAAGPELAERIGSGSAAW